MPKPFPQEFREDVVSVACSPEPGQTIKQIAADFDIAESCLRNWMRRADVEDGLKPGLTAVTTPSCVRQRSESGCWSRRTRFCDALRRICRRRTCRSCRALRSRHCDPQVPRRGRGVPANPARGCPIDPPPDAADHSAYQPPDRRRVRSNPHGPATPEHTQTRDRAAEYQPGDDPADVTAATKAAVRILVRPWLTLAADDKTLRTQAAQLVEVISRAAVPSRDRPGHRRAPLIAAGDNPDRLHSSAAFAARCGVNPIEASSGKTKASGSTVAATGRPMRPFTVPCWCARHTRTIPHPGSHRPTHRRRTVQA